MGRKHISEKDIDLEPAATRKAAIRPTALCKVKKHPGKRGVPRAGVRYSDYTPDSCYSPCWGQPGAGIDKEHCTCTAQR